MDELLTDEEILKVIWETCYSNIGWSEFKRKPDIKPYERKIAKAQLDKCQAREQARVERIFKDIEPYVIGSYGYLRLQEIKKRENV